MLMNENLFRKSRNEGSVILRRLPPLRGEPRRMGNKGLLPSFETPRKSAAPQDDGCCFALRHSGARRKIFFPHPERM
jgi:hypothetical protein